MKAWGSLWQYYRDEPTLEDNNNIIHFPDDNNNSISFTERTENNDTNDVEIMVPLKYPLKYHWNNGTIKVMFGGYLTCYKLILKLVSS